VIDESKRSLDSGSAGTGALDRSAAAASAAPELLDRSNRQAWWRRWRRVCGLLAVGLAAGVIGLWLLDVTWLDSAAGPGLRRALAGAAAVMVVAALVAGAGWLAAVLGERLRGLRGRALAAALVLPGLVALSLVVRFAGIDSEVTGRYYLDEGTYYHHATAINDGEVLRRSFVYPHLTYYADALTLWVAARFPRLVAAAARRLYGLDDPLAVAWLLLRGVVALLSALTVVPVYRIAERLAGAERPSGRIAGTFAALLLIVSDLYNEGSHLNTCDVPAAFFATLCLLFVARLVDRETARDDLLAGVAAGLAFASKYPAGLVALAVAVVWMGWRVRGRAWNADLLWAALAAAGTVIAVMPSLLAYPDIAFTGGRGIFFGARQYGSSGWLGVMPDSNAAFYAEKLLWSFGWPAVALGLSGLLVLAVRDRGRGPRLARLLWLAPFPVLFVVLITAMNMVVKRNLYPVLPILSVYLGTGLAAWLELVGDNTRVAGMASRGSARHRRWPAAAVLRWAGWLAVLACLWLPADLVARQTVGFVTPSTREEAGAWMRSHLPAGASIVKESYTPDLAPRRFAVSHQRFAGRIPLADLRSPQKDYLLLSSAAYARFRDPGQLFTPNQREIARRYQAIFDTFPLVREWVPDELQLGPVLRLYRLDPDPAACKPVAELPAADAFVPDEAMRPAPERPLRYTAPGQWSLFHACLPAGRYRLSLQGDAHLPGFVQVTDGTGANLGVVQLAAGPAAADVTLRRTSKALFYVHLAPGSRLRALSLAPGPAGE
jgi:Dolichyl-phosphate-mannose-protein mannosyltransferase